MKSFIAGTLLATALSLGAFAAEKTETIKVTGWHCAGCSAKTEAALKEMKGVKTAVADKDNNRVRVTYEDSKVKRADLEKAIVDAGFTTAQN
ncbi:MAG TPA: heavy metal-associated domain-containing protein [Myxococcales bacterium]|nr:heavy metal-associated domain-containing protein [Myxococcales bacterium]